MTGNDRFQDTVSGREGSCTLALRSPNRHTRNGHDKQSNSTMKEVNGWLESVVDEGPVSAREQRGVWFDARMLTPRSQQEMSLKATQILGEHAERSRMPTDNSSLRERMASRSRRISSALDPYIQLQPTRRASRGGTTASR